MVESKQGYDTNTPFMASSKNDVVTKAYTDAHKAAAGQGQRRHPTTFRQEHNQTLVSATTTWSQLYHVKATHRRHPWRASATSSCTLACKRGRHIHIQLTVKYSGCPGLSFPKGFAFLLCSNKHAAHCRGHVYVNSYLEDDGGPVKTKDAGTTIKNSQFSSATPPKAEGGGGNQYIDKPTQREPGYTTRFRAPIPQDPSAFNTIALLDMTDWPPSASPTSPRC